MLQHVNMVFLVLIRIQAKSICHEHIVTSGCVFALKKSNIQNTKMNIATHSFTKPTPRKEKKSRKGYSF